MFCYFSVITDYINLSFTLVLHSLHTNFYFIPLSHSLIFLF